MKLLILGGTRFVGRAVADAAVAAGWQVTTLHRGLTGPPVAGTETVVADRTREDGLDAVRELTFDAVVDTWSGAPQVVAAAAGALRERAGHYAYISSRSVYADPLARGADERAPVVDADPDSGPTDYPADKRGAELAVLRAVGPDRSTLLRAGLVLGPHENIGRLPWWLLRIARGGDVLAPGPPDLPLQLLDARDLAQFTLRCLQDRVAGPVNVVSRRGHATMGTLLEACVAATGAPARLVWAPPQAVLDAGIAPWTELPIWLAPDSADAALHDGDVERAFAAGLTCRPVGETVADTWEWVRAGGWVGPPEHRPIGLDVERERALLAALS